jgi:hypothetical protein
MSLARFLLHLALRPCRQRSWSDVGLAACISLAASWGMMLENRCPVPYVTNEKLQANENPAGCNQRGFFMMSR